MTAGARLALLSGLSGVSAGAHLYAIRLAGSTAGAMLASRSSLPSASAAMHLLDGGSVVPAPVAVTDPYQAIANNIYNLRVDGPANHVFMRIGARHPRRK